MVNRKITWCFRKKREPRDSFVQCDKLTGMSASQDLCIHFEI